MENETEEPKKTFYTRWWFWVIIVIFVIIIISAAGGGQSGGTSTSDNSSVSQPQSQPSICDSSLQTLKKEAQKISYKQLTKDPNSFMGKTASFTGQILEIQQSGDTGILRLSVTNLGYGIWDPNDVIYVTYNKATQAVQDDIVTVTGTLTGTETYTSQANYQITIPSMNICSVETKVATATPPASPPTTQVTNPPVAAQPVSTPTSAPTPTPTPTPNPVVKQTATWHTVFSYSDTSGNNTTSFSLRGSQSKITYSCTTSDSSLNAGWFNGIIEATDPSQPYPQSDNFATTVDCPINKTFNEYSLPSGQYYLHLDSWNSSYTVTIEDYY